MKASSAYAHHKAITKEEQDQHQEEYKQRQEQQRRTIEEIKTETPRKAKRASIGTGRRTKTIARQRQQIPTEEKGTTAGRVELQPSS